MPIREQLMRAHRVALSNCSRCPEMIGPVVSGSPVLSPILLIGQAPGDKEGGFGKPFAWTAGKTLFKWFEPIGLDEETFRQRVYMAAVCRCFPGKTPRAAIVCRAWPKSITARVGCKWKSICLSPI